MQGLKIKRLQLYDNGIFDNLDISFYDEEDKAKEPYTSLIIGPNGTGKSNLLKTIILLFQEINDLKKTGKRVPKISGKFSFDYSINGKHFQYCNAEFSNDKNEKWFVREVKPKILLNGEQTEKNQSKNYHCLKRKKTILFFYKIVFLMVFATASRVSSMD